MEEKRLPIVESREQGYNHGATGPKMDKESSLRSTIQHSIYLSITPFSPLVSRAAHIVFARRVWPFATLIAVVKRVGTALSHNCRKKKSIKREFLSLRVVVRKMNDTNMMYKNLAINYLYF